MRIWICVLLLLTLALTGCMAPAWANEGQTIDVTPYTDVRRFSHIKTPFDRVISMEEIDPWDIPTLTFNEKTEIEGAEEHLRDCMERGKNPGLAIRAALHAQGITGEGVTVAIIDQPMYLDHLEFEGKVVAYKDFGCGSESSMHGPAVASLLVGETIGTAPGARLYYAAAPSWLRDSQSYADALLWIVEENEMLPEGEKIRAVSVSAAPSGKGSPFEKNLASWDTAVEAATAAGIMVLDCRVGMDTGFIARGYYDYDAPEDVSLCKIGMPSSVRRMPGQQGLLYVPVAFRTVAEEYQEGDCSYSYSGRAGLSWGIPYATGVLAMGWQVNPTLSGEEMRELLYETGYDIDGARFIDPPAFIVAVKKTL